MKTKDANDLLERYRAGNCTEEELRLLRNWFDTLGEEEKAEFSAAELNSISTEMWSAVQPRRKQSGKLRRISYVSAAAVVALLIVSVFAVRLFMKQQPEVPKVAITEQLTDTAFAAAPGSQQATLTLADGSIISLTDAKNGAIAEQSGVSISKTADGELVYTITANAAAQNNAWNTIATPRGGQYKVLLPDGSVVWLNAESSLRYPPVFAGSERKVILTGEAYFDVSAHKTMPFVVSTSKQQLTVLGTQFNINAYPETDNTITTLLTGSVRVALADSTGTATLKPGQQSSVNSTIKVVTTDPNDAIAWKSGYLLLENETFEVIMKRIARRYDLDIIYQTKPAALQLGGRISMNRPLEEVLQALELGTHLHLRVSGKQLIVSE
ncbi:DUF4974 domain-containing protein [Pseudoflavitalea sp. G-6-1-2]|uniref:FecR family protein n=1 Tax=Pseudoflavitalea sp. G-6-1-2 TaxID=2728841 RepID=UPI00146EB7D0|nr:FecR domain-containing protein [Pseudoflavitalea sp. G-6-1-2]NML22486.1 DUF4974 domain-containing protein [Pseudoflavitalea sp. G-6-1-2]